MRSDRLDAVERRSALGASPSRGARRPGCRTTAFITRPSAAKSSRLTRSTRCSRTPVTCIGGHPDQQVVALVGHARDHAAAVLGGAAADDQAGALHPGDGVRDPAPAVGERVGELRHPHLPALALGEADEDLVLHQRQVAVRRRSSSRRSRSRVMPISSARHERCSSSSSHWVSPSPGLRHPRQCRSRSSACRGPWGHGDGDDGLPRRAGAPVPGRRPAARPDRSATADAAVLDLGVQDTGPDGAAGRWRSGARDVPADDLFLAWTLRGAPHAYRRAEAAQVAAAVAPWSEADAAKRIFDAVAPAQEGRHPGARRARPHRGGDARHRGQAGRQGRDVERAHRPARRAVPALVQRRARPRTPTSSRSGSSALQAGLELEPGTSPPVLRRIPRLARARRSGCPSTSTRSGRCCASSARPTRSSWPGTSTARSRR